MSSLESSRRDRIGLRGRLRGVFASTIIFTLVPARIESSGAVVVTTAQRVRKPVEEIFGWMKTMGRSGSIAAAGPIGECKVARSHEAMGR